MSKNMSKSRAQYGQVEVQLAEETLVMMPTLAAYNKIDTRFGGVRNAVESCASMNIQNMSFIVAAGAGMGQREAKDLPEKIFQAATINVLPCVTEFLMHLMNPTGKSTEEMQEGESDTEGEA
jgi:hypothetical protein